MLDRLSPWWLWALLALPPLAWIVQATTSANDRIFHFLVHPTGEYAAWLLVATLAVTPVSLLLKGTAFARWLRCQRRYLGVAAFGYAALHTLFYLVDKASLDRVLGELDRLYIWTGWLAFLIFLPLAATSMDAAVRKLGTAWKPLQRLAYAAAVLTLIHWASLHDWRHPEAALVAFTPLALLEIWRVQRWIRRSRPSHPASA